MNEVINHLSEIMHRTPFFLNDLDYKDTCLWIEMMILNNILLDMVTGKVMTNRIVYTKWLDFQDQYNNILNYNNRLIEVNEYYNEMIDYIMQICLEQEMYESAANIQKFKNFN